MEERNNNTGLVVVVTLLVVAVLGLTGFIIYDKVINKTSEPNTEENNKVDNNEVAEQENKEEVNVIEVTTELESELRELIPTIEYCKQYLFKQYNGSIFKSSDLTEEDKTSNFNECEGVLGVHTTSYKNESTEDEVYLYDYVLLYDMQTGNYGINVNSLNISYDNITHINSGVSKSSIKEYGQVYKYTFKLVDGNYEYVSTEAVK